MGPTSADQDATAGVCGLSAGTSVSFTSCWIASEIFSAVAICSVPRRLVAASRRAHEHDDGARQARVVGLRVECERDPTSAIDGLDGRRQRCRAMPDLLDCVRPRNTRSTPAMTRTPSGSCRARESPRPAASARDVRQAPRQGCRSRRLAGVVVGLILWQDEEQRGCRVRAARVCRAHRRRRVEYHHRREPSGGSRNQPSHSRRTRSRIGTRGPQVRWGLPAEIVVVIDDCRNCALDSVTDEGAPPTRQIGVISIPSWEEVCLVVAS